MVGFIGELQFSQYTVTIEYSERCTREKKVSFATKKKNYQRAEAFKFKMHQNFAL
jgi:hypothetical protein